MKPALSLLKAELYHVVNGEEKTGPSTRLYGDCSGLSGDCTGLYGDCSRLYGDCSRLYGDCTGLYGDCSRLSGNFDDCEITDAERDAGVKITDLVAKD